MAFFFIFVWGFANNALEFSVKCVHRAKTARQGNRADGDILFFLQKRFCAADPVKV
jgi:hypothetical protein